MTAAGPWSVKGIDPKAREIAKDLARRSGMTLGDWLNQMIIEGGEVEAAPPPPPRRGLDELYREAQAARRGAAAPVDPTHVEGARMARALETLASRVETSEQRASLAISGMDQSMLEVLSRLGELDREHMATGERLSSLLGEVRAAQTAVAERLRRAAEEGASATTLQALEAGLARLAARMDEASSRAEAADGEAKSVAEAVARRLDRVETVMEAAPAAYADAEKVEAVLTRMAERLDHNDTKTDAAMQSVQTSFANLDARLRSSEARLTQAGGQDLERRFQGLAQDLTARVEAARVDLAQRLRAVADGRLDRVETGLRELGGQMEQAEKRSAQAIDRIGREVMRVAHHLGERVEATERTGADLVGRIDARAAELEARTETRVAAVEARGAAAAEAMAGELSRVADAMEARLRDADSAQAQALEKLGGEIERIAERLAERIAAADQRQAEAMDEVTDKVSKIGSRFDERHDQVSGELSDRIRASEERTAQLLDEARSRLVRRAAEAASHDDASIPPPPPPFAASPSPEAADIAPTAPHAVDAHAGSFLFEDEAEGLEPERRDVSSNADPFGGFLQASPVTASPAPVSEAGWSADSDPFGGRALPTAESPFNPDDDFAPAAAAGAPEPVFAPALFEEPPPHAAAHPEAEPFEPAFTGFSVSDFAPPPSELETLPPVEARPEQLSTRQMLEAARQAARRAAMGKGEAAQDGSVPAPKPEVKGIAPRPFGITFPGRRKKETAPTLRTFVLASGIAGSLTAMGVGAYLMGGAGHGGTPLASEVAANGPLGDGGAAALAPSAAPTAAVALVPPSTTTPAAMPVHKAVAAPPAASVASSRSEAAPAAKAEPAAATKTTPARLYASAVGRLESGDLTGLPDLRAAAERGLPAAQFYLARLYDQGGAGLPKDAAQARRWTERAAQAGDPSAMYNLASYFYGGDGGGKDPAKAAEWFRKAAEHGVVNGQYNLAQLYEKGYGVPQSDAEAYKWYLVAAGSGDNESRLAAAALKPKLSTATETAAQNGAASVRAGLEDEVRTAAVSPTSP